MTEQLTPPPELFKQWEGMPRSLAFEAAYRAGADQELEACIEVILSYPGFESPELFVEVLRDARRSTPPSLKEQSLALIDKIQGSKEAWDIRDLDLVRRALEQLDD